MQKIKLILALTITAFLISFNSYAQGPGDPGGDPDIPIDGGVSLLLAAGVAYGGKKIADSRRKKSLKSNED